MAEDQGGLRKDYVKELAPWTKLFSAFKIALDPKKLLLAAGGILTTAVGWYVLAVLAFAFAGDLPKWDKYTDYNNSDKDKKAAAWREYKNDLAKWNLMYQMAGTPPVKGGKDEVKPVKYDVGDFANSPEDYEAIQAAQKEIEEVTSRLEEKIKKTSEGGILFLKIGPASLGVRVTKGDKEAFLANVDKFTLKEVDIDLQGANTKITLGNYELELVVADAKDPVAYREAAKAKAYKDATKTVEKFYAEAAKGQRNARVTELALRLQEGAYKPFGQLRTMPWFEDRGANPFLLVSGKAKTAAGTRFVPWERGQFGNWLLTDQMPVLLEPLIKFFRPILYLFDPAGGFINRTYLLLVIAWSLATSALFGGAITRIAAVQAARANERVGLTESLRFVWARYKSYFCAPLFPLVFLAIMAFCLLVFGFVEGWTAFVGDIVMPLLFPLALLAGLIMAVVLVGLVGYPLMYSTISAEGSDSFDAISRSYSYVYQAPWQYLWYSFIALCYGAVLVFFVGLMGSLMVYSSKWGIALAPTLAEREPSYLYAWAPTSYGWRDLLLHKSPNAMTVEEPNNRGHLVPVSQLRTSDSYSMTWNNTVAAFFVSVWLYLLFLLVIGFGYSYFWTSSTIIYLLMRRRVDDTETDEIHLEEEAEQPWSPPAPPAAAAPAAAPGTTPVQMVESPMLRTPSPAPPPPPPPPAEPEPPKEPQPQS